MSLRFHGQRGFFLKRILAVAAALGLGAVVGCTNTPSSAQRLEEAYKSSGIKRTTVYPLSGRVSIDNAAPTFKKRRMGLIVMAYNASNPDVPATGSYTPVKADGTFEFVDGGLPPGKYVLLFAALHYDKKKGLIGPDELKNLYNDPDVNAKKEEFVINLDSAGKTDCQINLSVAGEAPKSPGPKALTHIES